MVGARATSNGFIRMRPGEGARERTKREGRERVREGRTLGLSLLLEQGGEVVHMQEWEGAMWPAVPARDRTTALLPTDPNSQGID